MARIAKETIQGIREGLASLPLDVSHNASRPPVPAEVYTPRGHEGALDPDRALVVGNRGVGKSFWSGALIDPGTRSILNLAYPKLKLGSVDAVLGFSGDDSTLGAAPSAKVLKSLMTSGAAPETIWRAVYMKALSPTWASLDFKAAVARIESDPESYEREMLDVDSQLRKSKRKKVLVFDALDRLGDNWQSVRDLTRGLLRLALSLRSYHSIRAKIFIRPDQGDDKQIFDFPDASKLRAERVELKWSTQDLYGLMYSRLANASVSKQAFEDLASAHKVDLRIASGLSVLPENLKADADLQAKIFSVVAGEFMGSNHRRGRTYAWLPNHLGDAHGQTAPRTFLTALKIAADRDIHDPQLARRQAIDHYGIKEGVQNASQVRLDQLAEDHVWIQSVLDCLSGMEVPCPAEAITDRWATNSIVKKIKKDVDAGRILGPLEMQRAGGNNEKAILEALTRIGVIEQRSSGKINVPDIFRVAASMKRRGGIKPPGK